MNINLSQHADLDAYGPELADGELEAVGGGQRVIIIRDGDTIIVIILR